MKRKFLRWCAASAAACLSALPQSGGTLQGTVTLAANGNPLHHATVRITQLGRSVETDDQGAYQFRNLPPGMYTVIAHMHDLSDQSRRVEITAGGTVTADFQLRLAALKQEVTVTATGQEQTTLESFQTVTAMDTLDLAQRAEPSLGEVLDNQPGVAKRSFGPGSSRPVVRGFDGDRVLILQDGLPTGAISSQSGDHGESIDPSSLERLEVVRGPATLLYGSSALGGVVNAITGHHQVHEHPHKGLRGSLTAIGGTTNGHAGGSAGVEYGTGNWLLWADGSGQRTGDYGTPIGTIENSHTRVANVSGGLGHYGEHRFCTIAYGFDNGRYGVPFAGRFGAEGGVEEPLIDLDFRRHHLRATGGWHDTGTFADVVRISLTYTDWQHRELEDEVPGTIFRNRQFVYRGLVEQRHRPRWSGSFGVSGMERRYRSRGEESLSPPVDQGNIAAFLLEEIGFERFRIQLGGRLENNRYQPRLLPGRSFIGFSGAAGIHVPLWQGGAFVVNGTNSYRAPALEELYNHGPHVGNLTFELGNPELTRERSRGVDISLRHQSAHVRGQLSLFRYDIRDFVFLAPTGRFRAGLHEANYGQADGRFLGSEAELDVGLRPFLWLNVGADYVNAELKGAGTPLPRIPPLRGRVGLDIRPGAWSIRPELVLANHQYRLFPTETPTAGYAVVNLSASYTLARQHFVHLLGVNLFNANDRLYRNHLSFIKELAPEIGRGVRFTYTMRFF